MKRWMLSLSLVLVSVPAVAQQPGFHYVWVNATKPCFYSWTKQQDPDEVHNVGDFAQGSNRVELPSTIVELHADGGSLTQEWHAVQSVSPIAQTVNVSLKTMINRRTAFGSIAGVAVALLALRFRKRALGLAQEAENARQEEPLIRPDGQLPSRRVGGYRLTEQLGAGAMGVVYKGVAADGLEVAIKVPAPHLISDAGYAERFRREIKLGLTLKHPRVVRVLSMPAENEAYIVLEYVRGTTLEAVPRLTLGEEMPRVRRWLDQALDALAYIHSQGVIHRDLKPANLMVLPDDSIKLMDFGIAHKLHGTRLTGTDAILGTPIYMAPEQVMGEQVDARSDLFALGLIFWERLTGYLPYPQEMVELLHAKISQSVPPLSSVLPAPSALTRVIERMTQTKPQARYPDALSARADLLQG